MQKIFPDKLSNFIAGSFTITNPGSAYLHGWHIDAISEHLEQVASGNIRRLIINMPPRSLKSTCASVAWPAWLLGHNPATRIMAASYSRMLSTRHSQDTRLLLASNWYRNIFPATLVTGGENEKTRFVTTKRGFRFATSVGGSATGDGADILIVDDPHNPLQAASRVRRQTAIDWFDQTFSTRLNDKKNGAIIVVMQRLHVDDLTGHLLRNGGWEHLCLPAMFERNMIYHYFATNYNRLINSGDYLHDAREGMAEISRAKRELGSYGFAAQYQQNPAPAKGGMIEMGWIKRYSMGGEANGSMPWLDPSLPYPVFQSWDTAIKSGQGNDYSVCTTWAENTHGYYLLDVFAGRLEYPSLKRACTGLAEKWHPAAILIEDKASGQSLLQDLRNSSRMPVIAISPVADKVTRFARVTPMFESGKIYLPRHASWLADYEMQLFGFPNTSHDDMVDATSQFLNWIRNKNTSGPRIRWL